MKVSEERITEALGTLEGWSREDKWIVKKYRFREYMDGIRFVNRVAELAECMNHHPMIAIDYKMITTKLTSWSAGGLTELDFEAATAYDQAFLS
jgi:4a-hydroxytetrahydrobiopterin dehydratase